MILSTHFIAGAAVASQTDSLILIVVLPLILHFIMDMIPHWEYVEGVSGLKNKIPHLITDILAGPITIFLIFTLKFGFDLNMIIWLFIGGVISVLPDSFSLLHFLYPKIKLFNHIFDFHQVLHNKKMLGWKSGLATQIFLDILAIALITLPKA